MAELEGLKFLTDNEISEQRCDVSKPFAFISYAHDQEDKKIVANVFQKLYDKGYNLWIDIANIPKDEHPWTDAVNNALMNPKETCKVALFFRSEKSLISKLVYDELEIITDIKYINRIITIDIWHNKDMTADEYRRQLTNLKRVNERSICKKILQKVDKDNSAYRVQDVNHNLDELVKRLEKELQFDGIVPQRSIDKSMYTKRPIEEQPHDRIDLQGNIGKTDIVADEYIYTIFGKEYHAGKREQGKLMFDVFEALMERHPDKADVLTVRSSIARVEDVIAPNTTKAKKSYFRHCKRFTVGEQDYYVGTSYDFDAKLNEINEMLRLCGEPESAFKIISEAERETRNINKKRV